MERIAVALREVRKTLKGVLKEFKRSSSLKLFGRALEGLRAPGSTGCCSPAGAAGGALDVSVDQYRDFTISIKYIYIYIIHTYIKYI